MKSSTTSMRLQYLMDSRGLKQIDILRAVLPYATEAGLKMNRSDISQYVSGKVEPGQDKLAVLAKALHVDPVWLMGIDVPMTPNASPIPTPIPASSSVRIPVVGHVVAGIPTEAVEDIVDWEEIPRAQAQRGDYIGLKVKGSSMEPRFIEGDTVIVRRQPDVESGEIAIVFVNSDEATMKKVLKQLSGITLIAFNPAVYEPHFYTNEQIAELPVTIYGKVVELRGKL